MASPLAAPPEVAATTTPAPVDIPVSTSAGFLDRLPPKLSREERELGEAVLDFLKAWRAREPGSSPNMVHLGGDARVREYKALALPREVSLKAWLKQRFSDRVEVQGQSIVALD